ncbi:hypothetical protein DBV15_06073 [Temnothorax longispinosus]|uniref:Uncharacterized protein n=1 Tax=Temnothorax longispinosus TaxID=300112 RepID=A0A4S2L0E2_9HYME|nr:hypothetical protein DBV15_06073 [Temnothorax longispinosus]
MNIPTTKRVEAQVQKLFEIAVRKPPIINVAKHVKKDNLRPILFNKINRLLFINITNILDARCSERQLTKAVRFFGTIRRTYIDNDGRRHLRGFVFPAMIAGHDRPRRVGHGQMKEILRKDREHFARIQNLDRVDSNFFAHFVATVTSLSASCTPRENVVDRRECLGEVIFNETDAGIGIAAILRNATGSPDRILSFGNIVEKQMETKIENARFPYDALVATAAARFQASNNRSTRWALKLMKEILRKDREHFARIQNLDRVDTDFSLGLDSFIGNINLHSSSSVVGIRRTVRDFLPLASKSLSGSVSTMGSSLVPNTMTRSPSRPTAADTLPSECSRSCAIEVFLEFRSDTHGDITEGRKNLWFNRTMNGVIAEVLQQQSHNFVAIRKHLAFECTTDITGETNRRAAHLIFGIVLQAETEEFELNMASKAVIITSDICGASSGVTLRNTDCKVAQSNDCKSLYWARSEWLCMCDSICNTCCSRSSITIVSLIAASGIISHMRPNVHAAVSRTTTLLSYISSMRVGMACSTNGFNVAGSKPPRIEPNAIKAASLYLQS